MRTLKGPIGRDGLNDKLLYLAVRRGGFGDHLRMMPLRGSATQWPTELPSPCLPCCYSTLSPPMSENIELENIFSSDIADSVLVKAGRTRRIPRVNSAPPQQRLCRSGLEFCFEHTPQKRVAPLVSSYLCPLMSGLSPSACPSLKTAGRRLSPNCVTEWRGNILLDYLIFSPTSNCNIGWIVPDSL